MIPFPPLCVIKLNFKRENMDKMNLLAITLGLFSYSASMQAQLLKGIVKADSIQDLQITYLKDGNVLDAQYKEVTPDKNGTFTFDGPLPADEMDVTVQADNDIFGVHLQKGKTALITIVRNKQGKLEAKLSGDNAITSRFYNTYTMAYDMMKYWSPDPSEVKPNAEYRQLLEQENSQVVKALKTLKDKKQQDYYTRLSNGMYTWTKIRLIMDRLFDEKKNFIDDPEYVSLTKDIDPNDDINMATNLSNAWLTYQQEKLKKELRDTTQSYLATMKVIEQKITNPKAKALLTQMLIYGYSMQPTGDIQTIWNAYKVFAKDYPEVIAKYEPMIKTAMQSFNGKPLPSDPSLATPDGSTCKLSSLYGKLTYIDMWATWCGPCCKEIPHLEKVVEQYKGNDKIQFISISIDANKQAWLNKLKKDNPAWPQYLMPQADADQLMKEMGINGIPRFILLDEKGNIIYPDAKRPSDPELINDINANLK